MFPMITHIDDVLPYIEGRKEFKVNHRDECITIDYLFQEEGTFSLPILKECRGIKFDKETGFVKSRPFHKFFNHGEQKEDEEGRDFNDAVMYEKLDGSLLHFIEYGECVRACTKAGITDVSVQAENELKLSDTFLERMRGFIRRDLTLCFEYTSPSNRIVIGYSKPELTLLGVRDNVRGEYFQHLDLFSNTLGVPSAKVYDNISIGDVREWKEREGVVMVWPDGYRLKLKADDYVLKHRVKDQLFREHNVLQMVLNEETDDLAGILDEEDYLKVVEYRDNVMDGVLYCADSIVKKINYLHGDERKEVAQIVSKELPKVYLPIFWQCYDGGNPMDVVKSFLLKNSSKQANVDKVREIIGCEWVI